MRIGEAFAQFKIEFHLGNICNAIGNLFQNIKSSFGNEKVSDAMGSTSVANKTLKPKSTQSIGSSGFRNNGDVPLSKSEDWFEAHNQELDNLKEQAKPSMKTFFEGPTPTLADAQNLDDMTLAEAREFLGIRDGEETRLDVNERGNILKGQVREIYNENMAGRVITEAPEPPPGHREKLRHMEQKIEKAVELVDRSDFKTIPEPADD